MAIRPKVVWGQGSSLSLPVSICQSLHLLSTPHCLIPPSWSMHMAYCGSSLTCLVPGYQGL